MTGYRTPAHAIRCYFESYNRLASAKGLEMSGMPSASENVQRHMQERHGDLVLMLKELTRDEFTACMLRYAAAAGMKRYSRYVRTASDVQPAEKITKNVHPDDPDLIEVIGEVVTGCSNVQIARILGTSRYQVDRMMSIAHAKVGERMKGQGE